MGKKQVSEVGSSLGGAAEDDRGGDGQELKRTLEKGWGWQEVSDARGAVNQVLISLFISYCKQLIITISIPLYWRSMKALTALYCSSL